MTDLSPVAMGLSLAAGLGLGLLHFGGLWLTLLHLPASRAPALMAFLSLTGRSAVTVGGMYLVMGGRWERLVVCLAGFIVMRVLLKRRLGPHFPGKGGAGEGGSGEGQSRPERRGRSEGW